MKSALVCVCLWLLASPLFAQEEDTAPVFPVTAMLDSIHIHRLADYPALKSLSFQAIQKLANGDFEHTDSTSLSRLVQYQAEVYWKSPEEMREVIQAHRAFGNKGWDGELGVAYFWQARLIWDIREILPFENPKAGEMYRYEHIGTVRIDDLLAFEIAVSPVDSSKTGVTGTFWVETERLEVVGYDFVLATGTKFLMGLIDLGGTRVIERRALYENKYWLPMSQETVFDVRVARLFNGFRNRAFQYFDYVINPEIPPDVFRRDDEVVLTPEAVHRDSTFWDQALFTLPDEELTQVQDLPRGDVYPEKDLGALEDEDIFDVMVRERYLGEGRRMVSRISRFADFFHFNRVEGAYLGYGHTLGDLLGPNTALTGRLGYGFADERWKYSIGARKWWSRVFLGIDGYDRLATQEPGDLISVGENTLAALATRVDYFDYYRTKGFTLTAGFQPVDDLRFTVEYIDQSEKSVDLNTNFAIMAQRDEYAENYMIFPGKLRAIQTSASWKRGPIQAKGNWMHTRPALASDFNIDLIRFQTRYDQRYDEHSRILAGLELQTGDTSGDWPDTYLPAQYHRFVGGRVLFHPHYTFRAAGYREFQAAKYTMVTAEYIWNPGPRRADSIRDKLLRSLGVTVFGGVGKLKWEYGLPSWYAEIGYLTREDNYVEAGIGIGDRDGNIRIEFGVRSKTEYQRDRWFMQWSFFR